MMGANNVFVEFEGSTISAQQALSQCHIPPLQPQAKEGLALVNGTGFMAAMLLAAFTNQLLLMENLFALLALFLNAVSATEKAFQASIHALRPHHGQRQIAAWLHGFLANSAFCDNNTVQNDYSIRCLPQILGPLYDNLSHVRSIIVTELNSVTDNPLIFVDDEITPDLSATDRIPFDSSDWAILSGGNFHGEYLGNAADLLAMSNAKLAITLERHLTYVLNPYRNDALLPKYLIPNPADAGLCSGYMIPQYTANALIQQITFLGNPNSIYNITSANESEDIVSYGATACQKLLKQQTLLMDFTAIYLTVIAQAYAIQSAHLKTQGKALDQNQISERLFANIRAAFPKDAFPYAQDHDFSERYTHAQDLIFSGALRETLGYTYAKAFDCHESQFLAFSH